jgi:glutamyl-Q tRNA(Asp) synthetase
MSIVTRFAPSPTGYLHLGHAFSALFAWRRARESGGRFLLRLEDIDPARCRPQFADAILEDLAWLGLDWDGEVRVQSEHLSEYRTVLDALRARGLLYPCFCSRADIQLSATAPQTPDGAPLYPGTCRGLSEDQSSARIAAGERFALRLNMQRALASNTPLPQAGEVGERREPGEGAAKCPVPLTFEEAGEGTIPCHPEQFGDVVLARKDTPASYHLCVTHDDAVQGVTLVTRGADLKPATHLHRLLQSLMGWPVPAYAHHELLTDATGRRLAKRDRAATLRDLRARGHSPAEVRALATPLRTSG